MQTSKAQISLCIRAVWSAPLIVRCLENIIPLDSVAEISRTWLASMAEQAGLCLAGSETPEDTFCHVVAHF